MKMAVSRKQKNFEINMNSLTQLVGKNIQDMNFIIESIMKYFSGAKYMEYEEVYRDNISIDGQTVGRNYFSLISIRSREDMLAMLKMSKKSLLAECVKEVLKEYSFQQELFEIEKVLEQMVGEISDALTLNGSLELSFKSNDVFSIAQETEVLKDGRYLEELSNDELIRELFGVLKTRQEKNNSKILVVIKDVDHLFTLDEYLSFMGEIHEFINKSDVWIVTSASLDGFVSFDRLSAYGINCINEDVFQIPEYDIIKNYVEEHYPIYKFFDEISYDYIMRKAVFNIGYLQNDNRLHSYIVAEVVNRAEYTGKSGKELISQPELAFLSEKKIV